MAGTTGKTAKQVLADIVQQINDTDIKTVVNKYHPEDDVNSNFKNINKDCKVDVLKKTAKYLNHNKSVDLLKEQLVKWVINRLKNLMPENCLMCNNVIDHTILVDRLRHSFGVRYLALDWICSYLRNRSQTVKIGCSHSKKKTLNFSVPQGSVLGPKKYCMFSRPIGNIIHRHGLQYHCYADDTQVYIVVQDPANFQQNMQQLTTCLEDIIKWMKLNMLKLNEDKTEFIVFTPKHRGMDQELCLKIGDNEIKSASSVKNLGVHLDEHLTMDKQVTTTVKACYHQIKNISRIRRYITDSACKTLVQSLVISRLDYGNALYYGLPHTTLRRLRLVQNSAARLIKKTGFRDHITPVLKDLHWLPIKQRSEFKILVYVYKALNGTAPLYIQELIDLYEPNRPLRSGNRSLIALSYGRTSTYGDRRFPVAARTLWNDLPDLIKDSETISIFKKRLKTHLFEIAY